MASNPSTGKADAACEGLAPAVGATAQPEAGSVWSSVESEHASAKQRLAHLTRALQQDVIPRLVGAHARAANVPHRLQPRDIETFVALLSEGNDAEVAAAVAAAHRNGMSVESIFVDMFLPAARRFGELWEADQIDFSGVTICLGRLQRLLREWSPAFGREVDHPPNGRRILLAQHPDEQHSFGLAMVAEFFRRDGWEVLGGVGGAVPDPSRQIGRDWFDALGFSIGSETRLDWLKNRISEVRAASRNRSLVVLVGGPLFSLHPALAQQVGADASGHEGATAPALAESLLGARLQRR